MPVEEKVLCVPTAHVRAIGYFSGFRRADDAYRSGLLDPGVGTFRSRAQVETDPNFKQLIPYVILKCGNELFSYRRGAAGTEKRLTALRSIGIGGHISEADAAGGADPYRTGMQREIEEEVRIECAYSEKQLGFIMDDRTPVGSVHLGVVHLFELQTPAVFPREDALAEAGFESLERLWTAREEFETWSMFAMEELRKE